MDKDQKPLSILVIEDNEMFRKLSVEMLSGHNATSAKDATDGLAKYKKESPDIVFLDIGLPDKSGHEVLQEIIQKNPKAFVIMLTASNLKNDVHKSLEIGAKGYIIKPFSRKQIKDAIDTYKSMNTENNQ